MCSVFTAKIYMKQNMIGGEEEIPKPRIADPSWMQNAAEEQNRRTRKLLEHAMLMITSTSN